MSELASCVAERNAGSTSPADTAGAFGVSAGATRRREAYVESRCRIAHSRRGSPRSWQRTSVKTFGCVRSSRSRCARVPR